MRATYGEKLLIELSKALSAEFGKGFSSPNLRNFRQFYLGYPDEAICYTLCSKLTWNHNRLIMRIENQDARTWYLNEASDQNWSVPQLERNIQSHYFERLLRKPGGAKRSGTETQTSADFPKDPYVLEFLNLPEAPTHSEKDLKSALIANLQHFLLDLGKGFSFVGRQ